MDAGRGSGGETIADRAYEPLRRREAQRTLRADIGRAHRNDAIWRNTRRKHMLHCITTFTASPQPQPLAVCIQLTTRQPLYTLPMSHDITLRKARARRMSIS